MAIPGFILVIPGFILVIPDFILVIPDFILVIPDFILVIPDFILVIPDFILVIPAKAGIHTDSPPEPYCPVPPGLFIPEKAEIHRWRWIPAFAGMTTSERGNELLEFCDTLFRGCRKSQNSNPVKPFP
ncbi:hypothetical protein [Endozoicomonas sp. 8E]|uniref:hypothetical protein n=1 Tax=Endozoicomonas sp. 8E TaxID=3035692 RepID=UPI002938FDE2|nr:hypothetical protein [Endozoicomonas sp. 8E]WOG27856.1 hypothetical protein P6910_25460 [Endozoicomonas sp. 8E]